MSLTYLQQMGNQSGPYGGVATGHAPQQPNMGLGPNRYIPPTFNYGSNGQGSRPDYSRMDWNQMQAHYLPNMTNQGGTANTYMQQLQQMLGNFGQQYGGLNRQPQMPNFGSYNPGFGGPTSYYDQQQGDDGGGMAYAGGSPGFYDDPRNGGNASRYYYESQQPGFDAGNYGPGVPRGETPWDTQSRMGGQGSYEDYVNNFRREELAPGMIRDMSIQPGRDIPYSREDWMRQQQGGSGGFYPGPSGYGVGGRGGMGGRGTMPQFNPYVLMRNNLQGMNFNEMFDPRFAALFGGNRFGSRTPNSQMQQPIKPQTQLIDGQYASGGKPGGM